MTANSNLHYQDQGEAATNWRSTQSRSIFDDSARSYNANNALKKLKRPVSSPGVAHLRIPSLGPDRSQPMDTAAATTLQWLICLLVCYLCLNGSKASAEIIFSAKILGPVTNIYAIDQENQLLKLTEHNKWRDVEPIANNRGELLFLSNRKANKKIDLQQQSDTFNVFLKDLKKQAVTQITDDQYQKRQPLFSPDGKWISYIQKQPDKDSIVLIYRKTRKTFTLLSETKILDYLWSPNNRSIVFAGSKTTISYISRCEVVNKQSTPLLRITDDGFSLNQSKTGAQSITSSGAVKQPLYTIVSLSYSPNGEQLAYIAANSKTQQRQLNVLDVKNSRINTVSAPGIQVQSPIDWSNDSQRILYAGLENYNFSWDEKRYRKVYRGEMNLFLSSLSGDTRKLSSGKALFNRPVFSPDETQIAFLYGDSLAERDLHLKTMDIDGKNIVQQFSPVPGFSRIYWH